MSGTPSERFELLRQLAAKYWRPIVSWLAGISVVVNSLKALNLPVGQVPGVTGSYWYIGLGASLFIIIRFPRIAVTITRLILGPPQPLSNLPRIFRGPRPYGRGDVLPGRQQEIDDCWRLIKEEAFFILEGESGCGKSSLLNAALLPKAREAFRVIECRIADDPFGKLHAALLHEPYRTSHNALSEHALAAAITQAGHSPSTNDLDHPKPLKPLLLCIDQCEEMFVTVKDEVRWQFLVGLTEAIKDGKLRLLVAIRSDFRDLLDRLCRTVDPQQQALHLGSYYTLQAFRKEQAETILDEILRPAHGNDPLMRQQLEDLARALGRELLRPPRDKRLSQDDEKTVLPVELQTIGMILESVGIQHFSVAGLRRLGGRAGLMRAYIEDAKTYVWHKTGVPDNQALLILRHLISPAQTKWAQTAQSIGKSLSTPVDQVAQVLDAFAEKYLVNRLPAEAPGGDAEGLAPSHRYELMHEHLVQILAESPDPILQKARDAEERLLFWIGRTKTSFAPDADGKPRSLLSRLGSFLAQPIPLMESLRLWRLARSGDERRMLRRNLRGFCLRAAPVALFLMIGIFGVYQWYQKITVLQEWRVRGRITGASNMREVRIFPQQIGALISQDGTFTVRILARRTPTGKVDFPRLFIEGPGDSLTVVDLNNSVEYRHENRTIMIERGIHLQALPAAEYNLGVVPQKLP